MLRKPCNIFFAVTGRGEFPMDMLRRDEAEFISDSDKVMAERGTFAAGEPNRTVNLVMRNRDQYGCPTTKRWESFGWKVSQVYAIDADLPIHTAAQVEVQWTRIARAKMNMPAGWNLQSTGDLDGLERLTAVADNLETISRAVREVYEELRFVQADKDQLRNQRDAVREFFGLKQD